MANLPVKNSVDSNVSNNPSGGGDGGLPFRYISTAAQHTFEYLRKKKVKTSSIPREGRIAEGIWTSMVFQLIPPEDNHSNVEKSELFKNIRRAGGSNYPGEDVETDINGVVRILNEDYFVDNGEKDCLVPFDTYSSAFVYRCISNRNKGLPMPHPLKYLIPYSISKYAPYDAQKVLRREIDWKDIAKLVLPLNHKRISAQQWIVELQRQKAELMSRPQSTQPQTRSMSREPDKSKNITIIPSEENELVAGPSRLSYAHSSIDAAKESGSSGSDYSSSGTLENIPGSRRVGQQPQPLPSGVDGWVDCNVPNGESNHVSFDFIHNPKLRRRQEYSNEESQRILDLVCAQNAYLYVKCLKFWKQVEASKKFKRTYQSLENHFRRSIVPKVTSDEKQLATKYRIRPENLAKLKEGWNNKVNKHHTNCPEFKM